MSGNDIHAVQRGWTVRAADGGSLGSVAEVTESYLRLGSGPLGRGEELYVPAVRLAEVRDGEVRLDVAADAIDREAWASPPESPPARHDALINLDDGAAAEETAAVPGEATGYTREEVAHMAHSDYAAQAPADDDTTG